MCLINIMVSFEQNACWLYKGIDVIAKNVGRKEVTARHMPEAIPHKHMFYRKIMPALESN